MVVAQAELLGRGQHSVGRVAVGLARGDGEPAGQDRAGKRSDDLVADRKVFGTADNAAHLVARATESRIRRLFAGLGHAHLTPADGLAVALRLLRELENLAHNDRTRHIGTVDVFFFEAHLDQCRVNILGSSAGSKVDVFGQPTERNAHQTTMPNCCEKRTSPSTMSCMS